MVRPGYAVEYDFFPPHQVDLTLGNKINQGSCILLDKLTELQVMKKQLLRELIAGINAAAKITESSQSLF